MYYTVAVVPHTSVVSKAIQYLNDEHDNIVNGCFSKSDIYQEAFDRVMEVTNQDQEAAMLALELTGFDEYLFSDLKKIRDRIETTEKVLLNPKLSNSQKVSTAVILLASVVPTLNVIIRFEKKPIIPLSPLALTRFNSVTGTSPL